MNIKHLKWIKNITPQGSETWAYKSFNVEDVVGLHWKENEENAQKPKEGDLILLKQKNYITHIVEVIDRQPLKRNKQNSWHIYRIVEVLWVINNWDNPPDYTRVAKVFDYPANLQGGNVMFIETLPTFNNHWKDRGGLQAFQFKLKKAFSLN